jgi:glycosyltransferase involved in cell wall biosynthesis
MTSSTHAPIRVLHVLGSLNRGGVESWLMHVLRHIEPNTCRFDFCCLSGSEGEYALEARSLGSRVFTVRLTHNLLSFSQRFAELLDAERYDIVHSHVHHFSGYILYLAYKSEILVRIAHSHSAPKQRVSYPKRHIYLWLMRKLIKQYASAGLAVSSEAMVALFGPHWRHDSRWRMLYCGIDVDSCNFNADAWSTVREQYSIPAYAKVIGHVGSFSTAKNHQFLIQIAKTIHSQGGGVWFLLVGDGILRCEIEAQVSRQKIPRIIFAGTQPNVSDFLSAMDLFLFPSSWEGLPLSVVEAQAVGLRCLCSDEITKEVAVESGAVHFLSLAEPPEKWARESWAMLALPELDRQVAWEAVVSSPFAIETSIQSLMQLYQGSLELGY